MANLDETRPDQKPSPDETILDPRKRARQEVTLSFTEFGNYEILSEIARGGVGVVYRARQKGLERIVALKVLQGGTAATPEQIQRFMQEAQSAAKLQHANIVPIHDFGVLDGQHFFTMDFIEGQSLADVIAKGPMQIREAMDIVRQVSDALHYAHEHGVVHRDIKPGNILLDKDGRVKVTDFGLAKEATGEQMSLTMTGQVMGTPRYMSPEQAAGKSAHADQRADVFSLGVTLYEMVTGKAAFAADNVVTMLHKVVNEDPPAPQRVNGKVHRDVATICMKAMEKDPKRRYQTSLDMTEDIERFLAGEPIEAKVAGAIQRSLRKLKRHGKLIALNVVLLSLAGYLLVFYLNSRPSELNLQLRTDNADVELDGNVLTDEQLKQPIPLKAGKHRLQVAHEPDYDPEEIAIETKPGESRAITVALERRKGMLAVATEPPDAAITIFNADGTTIPLRGPRIQQALPTGHYGLLVHHDNYLARRFDFAVESRATNSFNVALPSITLWTVPTSGNVLSVPVVADLDRDGVPDVVAGDDEGNVYCFSGRSGFTRWVHKTQDAVQAPVSTADVNHDGVPDVLVGSTDKSLYCLDGIDGHELWRFETQGAIIGPTLLKDVNDDGVPDAFFGSADAYLYAVNGSTGQLLWKYRSRGRIDSALAWAKDALIFGSADRQVYAINPRNGNLLWQTDAGVALLYPPRVEGDTVFFPTPKSASDARTMTAVSLTEHKVTGVNDSFPQGFDLDGDGKPERIVVSAEETSCTSETLHWRSPSLAVSPYFADINGDGVLDLVFSSDADQLLALSGKDGTELGRIKLDATIGRGYTLDDMDHDGVPDVVVGAGRRVYCFAWSGGRKEWQVKGDAYYDAPFASADGKVIVKDQAGQIACYDPLRREPLWKVQTSVQPSPYAGVAAGQGVVVDADAETRLVRAFSVAGGKPLWSMRLPSKPEKPVIGTPGIGEDVVAVGDGVAGLYVFSLKDGKPRWQITTGQITAAPAINGDVIVYNDIASPISTLRCAALADGRERWKFQTSDPFPMPPTLVDVNGDGVKDVVALCDNGTTYALNGKTGRELWRFEHSDKRSTTRDRVVMMQADGLLATGKGDVICLDLKTGKPKWTFALKEPVLSESAIADVNGDGTADIIVGTMSRRVHCLSGKGGVELWSYEVGGQIRFSAPLAVTVPGQAAPSIIVGTGPPENTLYCLSGSSPRLKNRGWFGPWKELTSVR